MTYQSQPSPYFDKGMRVRWSAEGRRTVGRRAPERRGTVCAAPRSDYFVTVHWDGHSDNTRTIYSVNFIEPVAAGEVTADEPRS